MLCLRFASRAFFFSSYLNLPKSRILAERRLGLGIDLDKVRPSLLRPSQRLLGLHDAQHFPGVADNADLRDPDALVDTNLRPALGPPRIEASHRHVVLRCLLVPGA